MKQQRQNFFARSNWARLCLAATLAAAGACGPADDAPDAPSADAPDTSTNAFAEARIAAVGDGEVSGELRFNQDDELLMVTGRIEGLPSGAFMVVVHEGTDCAATADGVAGSVLSLGSELPQAAGRLGEVVAGDSGEVDIDFVDLTLTLRDAEGSIMERSVVLHRVASESTDAPGAQLGAPVGCGAIEPMPTRTYLP